MIEIYTNLGVSPEALRMIGVVGFILYIGGFAALQLEILDGYGPAYSIVNILAATLVLVSLIGEFNLASAMIQVSWIIIGVTGLALRIWQRRRRSRWAAYPRHMPGQGR